MRTTLNLDDDLARAAKQKAAAEGRTLTSVVEDALRAALEDARPTAPRVTLPTFSLEPMPGVNVDDPRALRDLIEDEADDHFRRMTHDRG